MSAAPLTYYIEVHDDAGHKFMIPADPHVQELVVQLKWIISQLPIVNIPEDGPLGSAVERLSKSTTPYAYLHPKTWQNLVHLPTLPTFVWTRINDRCPTRFVMCDLVPKGGIIFTPNKIPGARWE